MIVDITHGSKRGGLFWHRQFSTVTVSVRFSEEEKESIRRNGFAGQVILARGAPADVPPGGVFDLTVRKILWGKDTYTLEGPAYAHVYEVELLAALETLKRALRLGGDDPTPTRYEFD